MIQAKYIFTIEIDDEWKRTINCELPPHDIKTLWWLKVLKKEIDEVHDYCEIMYEDVHKMLLELSNKQWNAHNVNKKQQELSV